MVFDLETQKEFADVGGRENIDQLRMSVGVLYAPHEDRYSVYRESEVHALVDRLFGAPLVVGFNVVDFDFKVLSAYVRRDWKQLRVMDLMHKVQAALGHRVKLDNIAEATLGAGKTSDGLQAIRWFREKKWDELIEYCKADVRITWELYLSAKRQRCLWFTRYGQKTRIALEGM